MKEIKVGLKISREEGVSFFGIEEVNTAIKNNKKVVALKVGGAIMHKEEKEGNDNDNVKLSLAGFSIIVVVDE